jgi:DNA polymerase I-like protein with 3'-5' exonuclease and polymerase domains
MLASMFDDVTKNLKDAAYVFIGLGVISYQRTQAQAEELRTRLSERRAKLDQQVGETRTQLTKLAKDNQLTKLAKDLEGRFEPVLEVVEERLDTIQERLPERAKELVTQAREAAKEAQTTLRSRLNGATVAA